jgi:hypothetical protein
VSYEKDSLRRQIFYNWHVSWTIFAEMNKYEDSVELANGAEESIHYTISVFHWFNDVRHAK